MTEPQAHELLEAARSMLQAQASAVMRSEAVGETGMAERFTALRAAVARAELPLVGCADCGGAHPLGTTSDGFLVRTESCPGR